MEKYEKQISLKQIFHSLFRHWVSCLVIIIGFVGIGLIYSITTKSSNAYSYAKLLNNTAFEQTRMTTVKNTIDSYDFCETIAEKLKTENTKHSNGSFITSSEIKNGLIYPEYSSETTSNYYEIIYKNYDKTITKEVLDKVVDQATINLSTIPGFSDIKIGSRASEPQVINVNNSQSIILFAAIGVVAAFGASVLFDLSKDVVFDGYELSFLENDVVETSKSTGMFDSKIKAKEKRRLALENVSDSKALDNFFSNLHTNLEIVGSTRVISVSSPNDYKLECAFSKSLATFYAMKCRKTLLIDLRLKNINLSGNQQQNVSFETFELDDRTIANPFNDSPEQNNICKFSEMIKSIIPNLDMVVANSNVDSVESVKTSEFSNFIEISKEKYRHIIVIMPPLSMNREIVLLKRHITSSVIVCESSITKKMDIFNSSAILEKHNINNSVIALIK